ncbi:Golgi-associated plant pathogenesis-related protein 1 isoform X1 [Ammospiza nelsoni]|uniref:Golgi-associated plant pathogenesis-related protein 1 isoform X1 n=1 Tax=Ammospiza caudacuta TaxID=2857398 RepID=UPI002738AA1A|nr:Golgi-associated plant pathogenesis-related protein 1 isoform X1 [Ammospiza caudacuta]XP_059339302.1 Golgi-associated plant pathogenesis-related protein 1 isoform X1 [Ammospiza nelsoni]XP_059339312.1 Golgi-associated plant pathogenesis-related protein 1 isoform X1 [Ammospiza nelsoni]XP_059339322.1 Golgi-associated plant pathogenesis-related protein 1 isoform X1 [Ammospiza nelsoni]
MMLLLRLQPPLLGLQGLHPAPALLQLLTALRHLQLQGADPGAQAALPALPLAHLPLQPLSQLSVAALQLPFLAVQPLQPLLGLAQRLQPVPELPPQVPRRPLGGALGARARGRACPRSSCHRCRLVRAIVLPRGRSGVLSGALGAALAAPGPSPVRDCFCWGGATGGPSDGVRLSWARPTGCRESCGRGPGGAAGAA